jgi:hypothetical protein
MEPEGVTDLRSISVDITKSPITAERGKDWDELYELNGHDPFRFGLQVGRELAGFFSQKGAVNSANALADQVPPLRPGERGIFVGAAVMGHALTAPQIVERIR